MSAVLDVAVAVSVFSAGLAGLVYLIRVVRSGFKYADDVNELVAMTGDIKRLLTKELEHNHGGSIKDDIHGLAVGLHDLRTQFDEHVTNTTGGTP